MPQVQRLLLVGSYHRAKKVEKLVNVGILQPGDDATYGKTYFATEIFRMHEPSFAQETTGLRYCGGSLTRCA